MPDITPLDVIITDVQFTPDVDRGFYRWCAVSRSGLFAVPTIRETTQTELGALLNADVRAALDAAGFTDVYWGDDEVKGDLVAFLAGQGVSATVVNPGGS